MPKFRKYKVNEKYFDLIDSANKAYFLGLLASDGCNYVRSGTIQIQLQIQDIHILEQLRIDIQSERPISKFTRKNREYCMLRINSRLISNRLEQLGIRARKSLTLEFPEIPDKVLPDFIRGYFDGDGSLGYYKKKEQFNLSFAVTQQFGKELQKILLSKFGLKANLILRTKKGYSIKNTYQLCTGNMIKLKLFFAWIYDNAEIFLARKYERYLLLKARVVVMPGENIRRYNKMKKQQLDTPPEKANV